MILTSQKILAEIQFEPQLDAFQVNPHSIDIRLAEAITIQPGRHTMALSMEKVTLPDDIMATVCPRSSTNRRGVTLDLTGIVDAGYSGTLTLPLTNWNTSPISFLKGERVATLVFYRLEEPVMVRLSKYHNSDGKFVPDKSEENTYLGSGNIDGLKEKYSI